MWAGLRGVATLLAISAVVVAAWVWLGVPGNANFGWFALTLFAATVLATVFARLSPLWVAAASSVPTLVLAWSSFPIGDNDGLWVLILPVCVAISLAGVGAGVAIAHVKRGAKRDAVAVWPIPMLATLLVVAIAAGTTARAEVADPYPAFEQVLQTFPSPTMWESVGSEHLGRPRCTNGCEPAVRTRYHVKGSIDQVCAQLHDALEGWSQTGPRPALPVYSPSNGYFERRAWTFTVGGVEGEASCNDDGSSFVLVTVGRPYGK